MIRKLHITELDCKIDWTDYTKDRGNRDSGFLDYSPECLIVGCRNSIVHVAATRILYFKWMLSHADDSRILYILFLAFRQPIGIFHQIASLCNLLDPKGSSQPNSPTVSIVE